MRTDQGATRATQRTRRAQQAIQDQIKELILVEGLSPGEPMPTEAELVETLGISRNSVREALKALQAVDIVEVRHGFGTYVGECSLDPFSEALVFRGRRAVRGDRHDLAELIDVRHALEVGSVERLIAVITDDDLAALRAKLDTLREYAGRGPDGDEADRAFHEQLYAPLGNTLMSQLLRVFWEVYHELELPPTEPEPEAEAALITDAHQKIYDAVAARDVTRAATAINEHFDGARARIRG